MLPVVSTVAFTISVAVLPLCWNLQVSRAYEFNEIVFNAWEGIGNKTGALAPVFQSLN